MTCALQLTIWDRRTGLPLDVGLDLGVGKSSWANAIKQFPTTLEWHDSEHDFSVEGVRAWWTDSPNLAEKFIYWIIERGWGSAHAGNIWRKFGSWKAGDRQLRFLFELV